MILLLYFTFLKFVLIDDYFYVRVLTSLFYVRTLAPKYVLRLSFEGSHGQRRERAWRGTPSMDPAKRQRLALLPPQEGDNAAMELSYDDDEYERCSIWLVF